MKLDKYIENGTYLLPLYMITVKDGKITAYDFIKYKKEGVIRQFAHPASIDYDNDSLVIDLMVTRGKDTSYTYDEFQSIFKDLPRWDMTKYYQTYENHWMKTYLCVSGTPVENSR